MLVTRIGDVDIKSARSEAAEAELVRETQFLVGLQETPFVPRLREASKNRLVVEYVAASESIQDEALFLRNCIRLLHAFRNRGIRHGDLTAKNLIVRGDCPVALDFGESRFADEDAPDKRPKPDACYFWRAVNEKHPMRQVERWIAVRAALGGDEDGAWDCLTGRDVLDLGCYTGETTAMAAAEGARAVGVDKDDFIIEDARAFLVSHGCHGCQFLAADMVGFEPEAADIVFLFSTWAYMVQEHGRKAAEETLGNLIQRSRVMFFETQLHGDGPGPDFLKDDADVGDLLGRFSNDVSLLATIPVEGRDAHRTVWSVTPR